MQQLLLNQLSQHCHSALVAALKQLAVLGGRHSVMFNCCFWGRCADPWVKRNILLHPRVLHAAVALPDGRIAALGGMVGKANPRVYDAVEYYDTVRDRWEMGPALNVGRYGLGVAVVGGQVFAAGGIVGGPQGNITGQMEMLDIRERGWRELPNMKTPRAFFGCTAVEDQFFAAIGGEARDSHNRSCAVGTFELFDPRYAQRHCLCFEREVVPVYRRILTHISVGTLLMRVSRPCSDCEAHQLLSSNTLNGLTSSHDHPTPCF